MRLLYLDIDSLRPDHLGCYGYHRATSPNIDLIANKGVRFENYYTSDAPCMPSRTAMWSGRFGIHTGVINHAGACADPFREGASRGFLDVYGRTGWMRCLRDAGLKTATISPFGERHSAWHWYAGFQEIHNTGGNGMERADQIESVARTWLDRHAKEDNWFLHVNFWDPHTPYRTPASFPNVFADEPLPAWLTDEVRQQHWAGCGPHSAQEVVDWTGGEGYAKGFPLQPLQMSSMNEVRRMFDGYDLGVRYADESIGRLLNGLADAGVLDDTAIIVSADHGENLGELNIYGDHQTADHITSRVPLVVSWPGLTSQPRVDHALHYNADFAATTIELVAGESPTPRRVIDPCSGKEVEVSAGQIPENWDGQSFAHAFRRNEEQGRDFLVLSQGAWSCQRSVRFDDYLCIRSYHDGFHGFPDIMLFNVKDDPHEQHDLAPDRPDLVGQALHKLDHWTAEMMSQATHPDPLWHVMEEGGPALTRNALNTYVQRLRSTNRDHWADLLLKRHAVQNREESSAKI